MFIKSPRTFLKGAVVIAASLCLLVLPVGASEEEAPPPVPQISYIEIPALAAPLLRGSKVVKYMFLSVNLEVPAEVDPLTVESEIPRLRDAFLTSIYIAAQENSGAADIDLKDMRARLLRAAQTVLGSGKVTDILFSGIRTMRS